MRRKAEKHKVDIDDIIAQYHNMVYKCCYSFLFNKEDAEDVSQEVFISIYNSLNTFKEDSKISTWITRIAINKSLNHIRANKKYATETDIQNIVHTEESSDEDYGLKNKKVILEKLINELPEKQRVAFVMNKYNGLTAKEIADIEKCSTNSIEVLIHRSFKSIHRKAIEIYKRKKEI